MAAALDEPDGLARILPFCGDRTKLLYMGHIAGAFLGTELGLGHSGLPPSV